MKYFILNLIKNSSKRFINVGAFVLLTAMVIANICGVQINETIFITVAGLIGVNSTASIFEKKEEEFTEDDKRAIIEGFAKKQE